MRIRGRRQAERIGPIRINRVGLLGVSSITMKVGPWTVELWRKGRNTR